MEEFKFPRLRQTIESTGLNSLADVLRVMRSHSPPTSLDPEIPPMIYDGPHKPDELVVDPILIKGLLTRDFISRKTRCWTSLSDDDMDLMMKIAAPYTKGIFNTISVMSDSYFVGRCFSLHGDNGKRYNNWTKMTWSELETRTMERLENNFPVITTLLENFYGRLIAAGGAVTKALTKSYLIDGDIDFFFIDPDVESDTVSEQFKQDKATTSLLEAVNYLVDRWINNPSADHKDDENRIAYVFRGEFVTTVWLQSDETEPTKYQFIHRVYPSIDSVLGGFDLGPAMIAFTGRKIMATELGAWSALAKTIIVDTSRRSTSFEHRLAKYAQFCHLIFPGLDKHVQPAGITAWQPMKTVDKMLYETIRDQGFRFDRNKNENVGLISCTAEYSRETTMKMLRQKADKYGYEIVGEVNLQPYREPGPKEADKSMTREDLKLMLMKRAYDRGFQLNIDEFVWTNDNHLPGSLKVNCRNYLSPRTCILQLAKLEIHQPPSKSKTEVVRELDFRRDWNIRVRRDVEYEQSSDYDGQIAFWPVSKDERPISDYENGHAYPSLMVAGNFTVFRESKDLVSPLVAILCFKNSSTTIDNPYHSVSERLQYWSVKSIIKNAVNLNGKKLLPILRASLANPDFGDLQSMVDNFQYPLPKDFEQQLARQIEASRIRLMGVRWILRNPGTQWTSSINPIIKDPRDWYGEYYRSYRIGNRELETCLRLLRLDRLRGTNPFAQGVMPKDIFGMILRMSIWADSYV